VPWQLARRGPRARAERFQPIATSWYGAEQSREAPITLRAMAPVGDMDLRREKDGRVWRIGGNAEVTWIRENVSYRGPMIAYAIPPVFEAYATITLPVTPNTHHGRWTGGWGWDEPAEGRDSSVLAVLEEHTQPQPWWLGYLNTTGDGAETIFPDVPKVELYGWNYVLIEAGPEQAGSWREPLGDWKGMLPDLMFPTDRSWVTSTLWDDYWTCIGASETLIEALLAHPYLRDHTRQVDPGSQDISPVHRSAP